MTGIDHKALYREFRELIDKGPLVKASPDDRMEVADFIAKEGDRGVELDLAAHALALAKRLKSLLRTGLLEALTRLSADSKLEIRGLMWRQLHGDLLRTAVLWSRNPPASFSIEYPIWSKSFTGNREVRLAGIERTEEGFMLRNMQERITLTWIEQFIEGAHNVGRVDQSSWSGGF